MDALRLSILRYFYVIGDALCPINLIAGVYLICLYFPCGLEAHAAERWMSGTTPNQGQHELISRSIHYSRSRNLTKLKGLYYPPSLPCNTDAPIDELLNQRINDDIPDSFQAAVSEYIPTEKDSEFDSILGGSLIAYTVQPTHELTIGFDVHDKTNKNRRIKKLVYLRLLENNGNWYFIRECQGSAYFRYLQLRSGKDNQ